MEAYPIMVIITYNSSWVTPHKATTRLEKLDHHVGKSSINVTPPQLHLSSVVLISIDGFPASTALENVVPPHPRHQMLSGLVGLSCRASAVVINKHIIGTIVDRVSVLALIK